MLQGDLDVGPLEAIRRASKQLVEAHESQSAQHFAGRTIHLPAQLCSDVVAPLIGHLSAAPQVEAISHMWLSSFSRRNQVQLTPGTVAAHLAVRAMQVSPEEALSELNELAQLNKANARVTAIIAGIKVDEPIKLADDIQIIPFDYAQLPTGVTSVRRPLPGDIVDHFAPSPSGFLTLDFSYSPVFELSKASPEPLPDDKIGRLASTADRLAVISNHEVAVLEMWIAPHDQRLPADLGWLTFRDPSWGTGPVLGEIDLERETALEFLKNCEQFGRKREWDTLELSMSRFNRSRRSIHPEDRAIDLGTILEVLLMHDSSASDTNNEISFKLGIRGAWLLEASLENRKRLFDQIRKLYSKRSKAVHRGRLKPSADPVDDWVELEADSLLISRLITRIVTRGKFPDWTTLVLGGE